MRFWTTRSSTSYFSCFQPAKKTRGTQTNKCKMNFRNSLQMGVFSKCRIPLGKTSKEMPFFPPDFPEKTIEATPQLQTHTNLPPPPPPQTKKFVKSISNSHISLSFLLTINTFIHSSRCRSSLKKTIPDSRPKQAKSTPVFRPKRRKNSPDGAAHTFLGQIREQRPPPPPHPPGLQAELLQQLAMLITKAKIRLFHPIWLWLFYAEKRILFKRFRKFRVLCLQKCIP